MMLNEPSNRSGSLGRLNVSDDPSWVQPPDAENRMSGGVEGLRGEIPVSPSDPTPWQKSYPPESREDAIVSHGAAEHTEFFYSF